jgi:hypothetical protein
MKRLKAEPWSLLPAHLLGTVTFPLGLVLCRPNLPVELLRSR